ncbi:putative glycosyltransferase [Tieghemostelium lacteum]|uniref:Putative glycosyltransferase n=1 Tax=Tieghemostelium lacteum TaxID=361077 RepID=A0A151Z6R8_TIELA|nr:putative glycosyltransferase [Tieghemostelium lacteum]|eukprot:KYQ89627.1 putative glycosyltransferase [Tieghemostelium lacteum]
MYNNKNYFNHHNNTNVYNSNKLKRWFRRTTEKRYLAILLIVVVFFLCYLLVKVSSGSGTTTPIKLSLGLNTTFKKVPFAYGPNVDRDVGDVTLITQLSIERLERLAMMADKWRGPISAAIYIREPEEVLMVEGLVKNSLSVSMYVDIHLLYANHTRYPVNNLRNLAIRNSKTDWVLLIDVDFITPLHAHQYLVDLIRDQNTPSNDLVSYVIPSLSSDLHRYRIPDSKEELVETIKNHTIFQSNTGFCKKCHGPTNYDKWTSLKANGEIYQAEYTWIYEPFLLYRKSQINDYDERLKGYGWDKNTHTFGMACQGFRFMVLPNVWIVHMNHPSKPWEGTDTYSEQMLDSLKIVCKSILPDTKSKYGIDPNKQLYNEPLNDKNCVSSKQWSNN